MKSFVWFVPLMMVGSTILFAQPSPRLGMKGFYLGMTQSQVDSAIKALPLRPEYGSSENKYNYNLEADYSKLDFKTEPQYNSIGADEDGISSTFSKLILGLDSAGPLTR